jgi:hypothetical protein
MSIDHPLEITCPRCLRPLKEHKAGEEVETICPVIVSSDYGRGKDYTMVTMPEHALRILLEKAHDRGWEDRSWRAAKDEAKQPDHPQELRRKMTVDRILAEASPDGTYTAPIPPSPPARCPTCGSEVPSSRGTVRLGSFTSQACPDAFHAPPARCPTCGSVHKDQRLRDGSHDDHGYVACRNRWHDTEPHAPPAPVVPVEADAAYRKALADTGTPLYAPVPLTPSAGAVELVPVEDGGYEVWLCVGVQRFRVGDGRRDIESATWFADQLRHALDAFAATARGAGEASGAGLIAAERRRQVEAEDWDAAHDDEHTDGALAVEAARLAVDGTDAELVDDTYDAWGLLAKHGIHGTKPNRIRALTIAGALIAAEIDRLARLAARLGGENHA